MGAYGIFDTFCKQRFGAEREPLIYDKVGSDLRFMPDGDWQHVSAWSGCIAFETNLPATAWVEYGESSAYERQWAHDRHHYIHVQYLTGLRPNTTYHYKLVAIDERGNRIESPERIFNTASSYGMIRIPPGPAPYQLDREGAHYVVTEDLTINGKAFELAAADVTLDLGGHTVTYNNEPMGPLGEGEGDVWAYINQSAFGVRAFRIAEGFKIVNGTLKQGAGNDAAQANSIGFSPIYIHGCFGEVAGVTVDYSGAQVSGIQTRYAMPHMHHNVVIDRGDKITNRHQGVDAIGQAYHVHHNLIKRCRQRALEGTVVNNNEIYLDSYATNSIGIRGFRAHYNRVFGTGYHINGFGWHNGMEVHDNIVHLEGSEPGGRWDEYGDQVSLNGMRLTQYNGATKPYEDNDYWGNLISITARLGAEARGVQFSSDPFVKNLRFHDNVVKVISEDTDSKQIACVVTQGNHKISDQHLPILYEDNTFISNICNVRFGDYYGVGSNHRFHRCKIVRDGDDPRYHTFMFDRGYPCKNHVLRDCTYEGFASSSDIKWTEANESGPEHDITIEWTLTIETEPNADVSISDVAGSVVFSGRADSQGLLIVPVAECKALRTGDEPYTPHAIAVSKDGKSKQLTVDVNSTQTVEIMLTDPDPGTVLERLESLEFRVTELER